MLCLKVCYRDLVPYVVVVLCAVTIQVMSLSLSLQLD